MTGRSTATPVLLRAAVIALAAMVALLLTTARPAQAVFHNMVIDEVMAGSGGDANIQFVELKMQSSFQNLVGGTKLIFYNGSDARTGTFTLPNNVSNAAAISSASSLVGMG